MALLNADMTSTGVFVRCVAGIGRDWIRISYTIQKTNTFREGKEHVRLPSNIASRNKKRAGLEGRESDQEPQHKSLKKRK